MASISQQPLDDEFYLRYYVGHYGKFGHEFLEFEVRPDGLLRYANGSEYKKDALIRKQVYLSGTVLAELQRIVTDSKVLSEDDTAWPPPNADGRQELEVVCGGQHMYFITSKIGSLLDIEGVGAAAGGDGLKTFYFLIQDLRCFVFSLIGLHFKIRPTP